MRTVAVAAVVVVAAFTGSARADFTVSPGVLMLSDGPMGSAGNSILLYTYSGPDTIIGSSTYNGLLTTANPSLGQESAWNVKNTRFPVTSGADFRVGTFFSPRRELASSLRRPGPA